MQWNRSKPRCVRNASIAPEVEITDQGVTIGEDKTLSGCLLPNGMS